MSTRERRRSERRAEVFPVSIAATESLELEGQTVDFSTTGILLTARGHLTLLVTIKGERYSGRLVRAFPTDDGFTAYAVELQERVQLEDTPETTLTSTGV